MIINKERIALLSLFIVELLALNVLNLGNLAWGYRFASFILSSICIIPLLNILKEKKAVNVVISIFLIYLYAIVSALVGAASPNENVIKVSLILGVGSFFILGLFIGHFDDGRRINTRNIVSAFYIGLALFVGFSLIVTIYNYGVPFYHVIYANEPELHEVIQKAYVIIGFDSARVEIRVLANYAFILSSGIFGIFLIGKDQKQKIFKWIVSFAGAVGLLTLICLMYSLHLYLFLILGSIVYAFKTWHSKKHRNFAVVFGALVLFFMVVVNGSYRLNLLELKMILDNTKYFKTMVLVTLDASEKLNHIKIAINTISLFGDTSEIGLRLITTGNILLDSLHNSGFIAFICLTGFIVLQGIEFIKFYKNYHKNAENQFIILLVTITFGVIMFNAYILSTTLDFVLHGIILLLGVMCAQNWKVNKIKKSNSNAKSNLA